jgi:hypothetical protein
LVWLVVGLHFLTDTGTDLAPVLFLGATWLILACAGVSLFLTSPGGLRSRTWRRWWLAAGAVGALGPALLMTDIALMVRLYLCEGQVAAYATGVAPGTTETGHEPRSVGLFRVDGTEEYHGTVYLYTTYDFLDRCGLAYVSTGAAPPTLGRTRTRHLYGPWYCFRWRF